MKSLMFLGLALSFQSAFAAMPEQYLCNVTLMKYNDEIFMPASLNRFENVATKTFAQSAGAILTASSPVFLYDETPAPIKKKEKPKKDEVVINVGSVFKSWTNDESLKLALWRYSEKNKHGVHTKTEMLGEIELKGHGVSQVDFIDKYAVQTSCTLVSKE